MIDNLQYANAAQRVWIKQRDIDSLSTNISWFSQEIWGNLSKHTTVEWCENAVFNFIESFHRKQWIYIIDQNWKLLFVKFIWQFSCIDCDEWLFGKIKSNSLTNLSRYILRTIQKKRWIFCKISNTDFFFLWNKKTTSMRLIYEYEWYNPLIKEMILDTVY